MRITCISVFLMFAQVGAWKCGIGPFSSTISYIIAFPADIKGVNRCCTEHDSHIDAYHIAREEADRVFCQCLSEQNHWYVKNIIQPLFCTTVKLYTNLLGKNESSKEDKIRAFTK